MGTSSISNVDIEEVTEGAGSIINRLLIVGLVIMSISILLFE
jgi:hypothetical protein